MDQETLDAYVADLASADPSVRDEGAFSALATAISDEALDPGQRHTLGLQMIERLEHVEPFARSFAPLILATLAGTWSVHDGDWPQPWTDALLSWWTTETDLRGYDTDVGWIHAVAHGADAVGSLGIAGLAPSERLLAAVAERLTAATDHVWRAQEDDRVAAAVIAILLGTEGAGLQPLLTPIEAMFATAEPGPVPPAATNTMHTLRSLYVALDNTVVDPRSLNLSKRPETQRIPNAAELRRDISATLQVTTPWLFTVTRESAD